MVAAGHESANIGKVLILRDEELTRSLDFGPEDRILEPSHSFIGDGVDLMRECSEQRHEPARQVLVQLDLHRT